MIKESTVCYVILLNYNSWKDTIECVESVMKSDLDQFKIIICDNHSNNQSLEHMKRWAAGEEIAHCSNNKIIKEIVYPLISKPLSYQEFDENVEKQNKIKITNKITFISLTDNRGFAGGMNAGISLAVSQPDCQYVWCLNNDTVVKPDAMRKLVEKISSNPHNGICSSKGMYYDSPGQEQWLINQTGFNRWLCIRSTISNRALKMQKMASYNGASFMVTREFIQKVGLMEERYFLYCEEWDWTIRGKRAGFRLTYAEDSVIYHKQGRTTGGTELRKSYLADYYGVRSKILFTQKFYPYCLPTVYLGLIAAMLNRVRRKQYNRIWMILKLMINPYPKLEQNDKGNI